MYLLAQSLLIVCFLNNFFLLSILLIPLIPPFIVLKAYDEVNWYTKLKRRDAAFYYAIPLLITNWILLSIGLAPSGPYASLLKEMCYFLSALSAIWGGALVYYIFGEYVWNSSKHKTSSKRKKKKVSGSKSSTKKKKSRR